jgi:RNA 3'-phosphate cyclase
MIDIDGSFMEGGGQIVRTALALSTLTGKPFKIDKIRHQRPRPGLKPQHLSCIDALKQLANVQVNGDRPGSVSLEVFPNKICSKNLSIDIGTAGSITLLLQSLLLPSMFADAPVRLKVKGGTDTKWSIPIDYFIHVILPYFNQFAACRINRIKRGYYPRGQGMIDFSIVPRFHLSDFKKIKEFSIYLRDSIAKISLDAKPDVIRVRGKSSASIHLKGAKVAERQAQGAADNLADRYPVSIECDYQNTASAGSVITLWTVSGESRCIAGADALGEKGLRAEKVGAKAALKLFDIINSNAVVDHHLADNLVPLLALVGGSITADKISGHIRSNIYVCEQFLDVAFSVDENKNRITANI